MWKLKHIKVKGIVAMYEWTEKGIYHGWCELDNVDKLYKTEYEVVLK